MKPPKRMQPRKASLARYKDGTYTTKISFPYDPDDIALVKSIPGRKWVPHLKVWTCPITERAIRILETGKFLIDPKLKEHISTASPLIEKIPGLKKDLFPYQKVGVSYVDAKGGRALIGDEMGLGKTVQALAWLQLKFLMRPAIIVCPAAVKLNWAKEAKMWMDPNGNKVEIVEGRKPYILHGDLLIINYDLVDAWLEELVKLKPLAMVLDECQYIKSNKAKRTKAVRALGTRIPHVIALSGTPIVNRPVEFYNVIQLLNKNLFPNWLSFTQRYCNRKNNGFGWDVSGATNTEELHEILSDSLMIRRTKKEVLKDLPDKIRSFFPLEMTAKGLKMYENAEDDFLNWLEVHRGKGAAKRASMAETLTEIEVLKQIAVEAKMPHAIEWIDDFLETGEKLVIFCTHHAFVDQLAKEFGSEAVVLDGRTSGSERQHVVDEFQNNPDVRLFIGNIKAAGVGITLTAASNVAFLELPWTPGDLVQAEDRCHRIGQKNTVNVYYLLAEYTIEERVAALLDDKRKVLDSVLDGKKTDDSNLIMELIENY